MAALLSDQDLLARLVAFDSVSRNSTRPIAEFIADYLARPGVRIHRNEAHGGEKANLVIELGPEPDGSRRGLVLSGHMDVVPADEEGWETDPFTLARRGDALVGRGAADMKGFLALAMNRAAGHHPRDLSSPLILLFTFDEELGTLGAKHFVDTWPAPERLPRDAIIGEPTGLRVVRMHKGYLKLRLTLRGVPAHSGYPHLGRSAIEPAARAVSTLAELRRELETERPRHHEHFPEVPYAPLNVGVVSGGVAVNVVPERCVVEFGIRLLPEMASDAIIARLRERLAVALEGEEWTLGTIGNSPPMMLSADAPLYRDLCDTVHQTDTRGVHFATDAGWFATVGLECVIFGPGAIEVAHKPNEFVPLAELERAGAVLEQMIRDRCGPS